MDMKIETPCYGRAFFICVYSERNNERMNSIRNDDAKFWAGGLQAWYRSETEKKKVSHKDKTGKGIIGWWQRIVRRHISNGPLGPASKEIDERLFIKNSGKGK